MTFPIAPSPTDRCSAAFPSWMMATTAASVLSISSAPVQAASARDVARVAVPTTVRIDNPLSPANGGSGVIVSEKRGIYTVLTANHVVSNPNIPYQTIS